MKLLNQKEKYRLIETDELIHKCSFGYIILRTSFKLQIQIKIFKFKVWITFKEIVDETGIDENIKFNRLNAIELFNTIINV